MSVTRRDGSRVSGRRSTGHGTRTEPEPEQEKAEYPGSGFQRDRRCEADDSVFCASRVCGVSVCQLRCHLILLGRLYADSLVLVERLPRS